MKRYCRSSLLAVMLILFAGWGTSALAQTDDTTNASTPAPVSTTQFSLSPSLDISIKSESQGEEDIISADWISALSSRLFKDGEIWQLGARVDATYGQHISEQLPEKTQDDLILSVTPSHTILPAIGLRLFLEVTGETQFTKGMIDTFQTDFVDPLFLYQSLFLGKRLSSQSEDGSRSFDLTAGVGYAWQETIANNFVLEQNRKFVVTDNSPLSSVQDQVTFESGYCAIVDANYSNSITTDLKFSWGCKTVALTKSDLDVKLPDSRITSLLSLGLQYKIFNLAYRGHIIYDHSVSLRRQFSQYLAFGLKLDL